MKKYIFLKKALSFCFLLAISFAMFSLPAFAQSGTYGTSTAAACPPGQLCNPLGVTSVQSVIGRAINYVMGVVGSIALAMFVYGGITWMISLGKPEQIKRGKDIIVWSAIGLVVIFGAYALTKFIITVATN